MTPIDPRSSRPLPSSENRPAEQGVATTGSLQTGGGERPVALVQEKADFSFTSRPQVDAHSPDHVLGTAQSLDPAQYKRDLETLRDASEFFKRLQEDPSSVNAWLMQKLTR